MIKTRYLCALIMLSLTCSQSSARGGIHTEDRYNPQRSRKCVAIHPSPKNPRRFNLVLASPAQERRF